MQSEQCQQHLKANSWKSQEGWGGGCFPLIFLPSNPKGFIVPRESCGGVGVLWCAKCFFFHSSSYSVCKFTVIVILCLRRWQKACVTCRGAGEKQEFLCTEYTGGRQSESSKCDSMGPSRHRQTKKENPHGCTCKSLNTQWFNKESRKYTVHTSSRKQARVSSSSPVCTHTYKHTAWLTVCLARNSRRNN